MSGSRVDEAIKFLLEELRAEGVNPANDGHIIMHDPTPDQRLLFTALSRITYEPVPAIAPAPELGNEVNQTGQISDPAAPALAITPYVAPSSAKMADEGAIAEPYNPPETRPALTLETVPEDQAAQAGLEEEMNASAKPLAAVVAEGGTPPNGNDGPATTDQEPDAHQPINLPLLEDREEAPQSGDVTMMTAWASSRGDTAVPPLETVKKSIYLKNARMDEPYVGLIEVPGLLGARLLDDGGTGLWIDKETGALCGQPNASGDFVIRIQGLLAGRRCDVQAHLAVIPDPRSLWISKPHDRTAHFAKKDEDSHAKSGDLFCVGASKRGRSHAQEGLFRDDDFALWTGGPGSWHIAVVADGAGSAKYSRRGSRIAVETIVQDLPLLLDKHLTNEIDGLVADLRKEVKGADRRIKDQLYFSLAKAAFKAAKAIEDEAERFNSRASAFSTTLVLSVARKGPYGWFVAGFSIGDGGAAIFDLPSKTVKTLTLADSGEFAGQTRFLQTGEFNNYNELTERIFFDVRDSFTAVVVMTDGITDPKFPTDSAFASSNVWCSFWETDLSQSVRLGRNNPTIERELLAWLDFWSPGNHDDRTIAIMLP